MTLSERLHATNGRPTGFDYLRLVLSAGVICYHSVSSTEGFSATEALFFSYWGIVLKPIVPMFFGLSGFLVAGSVVRCRSLVSFGGLRILRIVPALGMEVFISALVLGPLITVVPLYSYFSDPLLYSYFLNILGWIHYTLPGVFVGNPFPNIVNGQLWTVPHELECYVILAILCILGIFWKTRIFVATLIVFQIVLASYVFIYVPKEHTLVSGRVLILCFLVGVVLYICKEKVIFSAYLFFLALCVSLLLFWTTNGDYFVSLPLVYVTVYIGLLAPPKLEFLLRGDYSYGMYLYGYPIQQMAAALLPGMSWQANIAVSLPLAFIVAHFSWWWVEKPALSLRSSLLRYEVRVLQKMPRKIVAILTTRPPVVREEKN